MASGSTSLRPLRLKLTLWYLSTLFAIGRRFSIELDESLRDATAQLERAAQTREVEAGAQGKVVDAVEELHIADRTLYLLDSLAAPVTPADAPGWVRAAAAGLGPARTIDVEHAIRADKTLKLHAERFMLSSGRTFIAVAVADRIELEDRYSALITEFGGAAIIALVLVTGGGWLLVRQATAPIEQSVAQMRRFMADAAHELRTPITVLRTQAEVALQRSRDPDGYVGALRGIESESRRLGRIVDDLLTLARADVGEPVRAFSRVFLDDIVLDAVGAAGAMATAKQITLSVGEFEEAAVDGDAELLRQLAMILLDNAIKFTAPNGKVEVTVGAQDGRALMRITDNGPGIRPEQLPHIFERFYRGDPARSRGAESQASASGAGLGLSIAQWIAMLHSAEISVVSDGARGTSVTVAFPGALSIPAVSSS